MSNPQKNKKNLKNPFFIFKTIGFWFFFKKTINPGGDPCEVGSHKGQLPLPGSNLKNCTRGVTTHQAKCVMMSFFSINYISCIFIIRQLMMKLVTLVDFERVCGTDATHTSSWFIKLNIILKIIKYTIHKLFREKKIWTKRSSKLF